MGFGVPTGYKENPAITDKDSGGDYWTSARLALSGRHQWSVYRLARDIARERNASTVLDVGCGPATKLHELFTEFRIAGIDQPAAVEICRDLGRRGEYAAADLSAPCELPLPPADVVICADVIEHLSDPMPLLALVRASVAPGGVAVLSTPDRRVLLGEEARTPSNPSHVREWTSDEFAELLTSAGLRPTEHYHQLPFRLKFDMMSARWLLERTRARRSPRTNQVVVAEVER